MYAERFNLGSVELESNLIRKRCEIRFNGALVLHEEGPLGYLV